MEKKEVKGIPYGVASFEEVRSKDRYYVDKTMYLPLLEEANNYLFLIRPRRFGKSVFVSMMQAYYDIAKSDRFDTLFDGLWIKEHPTPLKNAFQVIYFDFSQAGAGMERLEYTFNDYCCKVLDRFIERYRSYYSEDFFQEVKSASDAANKLRSINTKAHELGYPLYLIIDEYDNFTNVILSEGGKEMFRNLTHASGFYREYFKIFKAMFSRIFMIGVSPVTLDDLTSGYNIGWNISQDPRFNYMLGFSESDVRTMFRYYQEHGKLHPDADIEAMLVEMKPWYNNYCFAEECLNDERIYDSYRVLNYLLYQTQLGHAPQEMEDKCQLKEYCDLKILVKIDYEKRIRIVEDIMAKGSIPVNLETSFPAEDVASEKYFLSLLYYYGLLTLEKRHGNMLKMCIPNNSVKGQYETFLYYNKKQTHNCTGMPMIKS